MIETLDTTPPPKMTKAERREAVQQIMSTKLTVSPKAIRYFLKDGYGIQVGLATIERDVHENKKQNWAWLSDTAKSVYVADMRDRAIDTKEVMKHVLMRIRNPDTKDGACAMLASSFAKLSQEMRDIIEGEGIYHHWDQLMSDASFREAAMEPDKDNDETLT